MEYPSTAQTHKTAAWSFSVPIAASAAFGEHILKDATIRSRCSVEKGNIPATFHSASWSGRFDLSEGQKEDIQRILAEMRTVIETTKLSDVCAMALIECAEKLVETPDPLWPEVMRLLRSVGWWESLASL